MIEREPVRDTAAAVVAAGEKLLEPEAAHELEHVLRHRAFTVSRMIRCAVGLVRVAVPAKIRHHERELAAQALGDAMPDHVRLRKTVQQQ